MKLRLISLLAAVTLLSACSSLQSLLSFEREEAPPPVVVAATPAPPPAAGPGAPNDWCQRVAASDRQRAQQGGFDAATLDRMTVQSYQQCIAMGMR